MSELRVDRHSSRTAPVAVGSGSCAQSAPGLKDPLRALLALTSTSTLKVGRLGAPGCERRASESPDPCGLRPDRLLPLAWAPKGTPSSVNQTPP